MSFKMKYEITPAYLTKGTKRRSGRRMSDVSFNVAHDTGNKGSTARNNVDWYERTHNLQSASAHIFVDDEGILECVPLLTAPPEKAWHVMYQKPYDDEIFGKESNDYGAGVEYCYGNNINADEAYKRYVWVLAYIAYKFKFDPKQIAGHHILDPQRKSDPVSGLRDSGRTYEQLIKDVIDEYEECTKEYTKEVILKMASKYFKDLSENHWGTPSAERMYERGLLKGDANGQLNPKDPISKIETVVLLDRVVEYILEEIKK